MLLPSSFKLWNRSPLRFIFCWILFRSIVDTVCLVCHIFLCWWKTFSPRPIRYWVCPCHFLYVSYRTRLGGPLHYSFICFSFYHTSCECFLHQWGRKKPFISQLSIHSDFLSQIYLRFLLLLFFFFLVSARSSWNLTWSSYWVTGSIVREFYTKQFP